MDAVSKYLEADGAAKNVTRLNSGVPLQNQKVKMKKQQKTLRSKLILLAVSIHFQKKQYFM